MTRYIPGQVYKFIGTDRRRGRTYERRLIYIGRTPSTAIGGLELFKSTIAEWKESFTRAQLGDFRSIVAAGR